MKLSFITVVRNALPQLQKTLAPVLKIRNLDYEIIVVDGDSHDGTREYLSSITHPNFHFISEPDSGIYSAMNKGLLRAKGEFVYFLNAGDELYDLEAFKNICAKLTLADVYYCNILLDDHFETKLRPYPKEIEMNFWFQSHMCHQAVIFRRSLFEQFGPYDERLRFAADFDFIFKAWLNPKIRFEHIDEIIAIYDVNGASGDPKNYELVVAEFRKIQKKRLPTTTYLRAKGLALFKDNLFINRIWFFRKLKALVRTIIYFFIPLPVGQFDFYFNPKYKEGGLRVLHLNTYAGNGGASVAAFRLNAALNEIGVQSQMVCLHKTFSDPSVSVLRPQQV